MYWQDTPYTLPLLGAAAVSAALAFYAWRRRSAPGVRPFIVLLLGVAVWSLGYALELASANLPAKLFWARLQYLGIIPVPAAWLAFVLQYTNRARWLTRRNLFLLVLPSLVTLFLAYSNDLHHLIWTSTRLDTSGPFSVLVLTHGAAFWGTVIYIYSSLLLGSALLFQILFRRPHPYRGQAIAVLIGVLAPWVGNALYISGLSPFPYLDLTPLAFTLTSLAVVWGLFRFRLLDIVPVARSAVLDSMDDAVIVLDEHGRIVDVNPAAERLIASRAAEAIGQPADSVLSAVPALAQWCSKVVEAHEEVLLGEGETLRICDAGSSTLRDRRGLVIGRLIVLRDVTERRRAERAIRDSELKYRTLFQTSTDAIFVETLDGRVLDCNAAACDMLGYTKEELMGLTVADLVPEEVAKTLPDLVTEELTTGGVFVEAANKRKDGQIFPVEVSTRLASVGEEQLVMVYVRDVSARKQIEQQSNERRLFLESVLACAPDAIITLDAQHRILDWNRGAEELFGYPREEVIGQGLDGLVAGSEQKTLEEATGLTRQVLAGTPVLPTETVRYGKNGSPVDVIVAGSPIMVQGKVTAIVATYRDIAERKRSEKAIRESEERYRTLVEQSLQGIVIAQGFPPKLIFANAAMADILGYSVEELLSLSIDGIRALAHPEDQIVLLHRYQDRLAGQAALPRYELRVVRKGGAVRWIEMFAGNIEVGGRPAIQATFVDITERKRAEEELRRLKEFNEGIVQSMAEGIAVEDAEGHFTFVNPAAATLLGYTPTELQGQHWTTVVPPEQQPIVRAADERRGHGQADRYELELAHKNGARLPVLVSGSPRFDTETGCFAGTLAVFSDISERVRAEEALRRRTEQLEALRQVGLEIGSQLDVDTLLHSIVSRAVELLGGTAGGFYLHQPEQETLQIVVGIGLRPSIVGLTLAPGEGLAGRVWGCGQPLVVDDYRHWEGRAAIFDDQDFRATVGVPVCWGTGFMGVLDVVADTPGVFGQSDAELLSLFASQAAIAIQNARLFRAQREQRELAEVLREAAHVLGASLDLNEILRLILMQLKRVLAYDTASVLILRDAEVPDVILGIGYTDERMTSGEAGNLLQGSPILRRMAHDLQPVVSPDVRQLDGWIWVPGAEHVRSWLGIPLVSQGQMIGALMVDHAQVAVYGEAEVQIAQAIGQHAAQAIENARLYSEARRRNRELALLNRVIAASAASQEITAILETVCRELAEAFGIPHSAAALLNAEKTEIVVAAEYRASGRPSVLGHAVSVIGIPLARELLEHKKPLIIDDARSDPRLGLICSLIPPQDPISLLLLPILTEGEIVGGLGVAATGSRSFTPTEVDLACRVAEQVSGALARARLAETERRLSTAVDQAAEAVVVTDADATILYVNPAFERIVGYSRAEVIGQHPRILGSSRLDLLFQGWMWQMVTGGQPWQERLDYSRRDGRVCYLDMTIAPVRDQTGEIVSYVTTMRDVTRETQLEAEFQQAQKMEALGRLAGGVAHDINNLLAVIQISAQLMERKLHADDPLRAHVGPIRDTVDRATRLTGQLLRFSRREVVQPQVLNLNQVVGDMGTMLQRIIGEDIRLVTMLTSDPWSIQADPTQIDQVIANLAVNARDAMPAGGALTIDTANVILDQNYTELHVGAEPGEYMLLAVSDTGVGMDDGVKARIFEPFFTTKEPGQGTGLGLATVFGIVKQGGGRIEVYSEVGQGTSFKIYWPHTQGGQSWPEAPSRALSSIPGPLVCGTETVLLVEDDAPVRELAERILQSCGYHVLAAGDSLEALQVGEQYDGPIHLLLSDVVLPHMKGSELAGHLLHARPVMRVLYMSGYTDGAIAQQGVLPPGTSFLAKPFTIEALTQTVRDVLDSGGG